ncbi:WD and tetratricopeptide repeats protein 1-like [Chiloscyllium plagiosum]|uniref:WD and tetratricopeptide repeats protein 1-like n=1 Tax=Chiloscyllium plagiosum TaxID=36176 RepID=UPI001CB7FCE4|nr:WD and tetratricopeptide repeats protein 1-like [Chiloscyllium plagiosum]
MIHNHRKAAKQNSTPGLHTFCDRYKSVPDGAVQYYVAGHLPVKQPDYNNRLRVLVATYVAFNPDGTELLVNMGGEQIRIHPGAEAAAEFVFAALNVSTEIDEEQMRLKPRARNNSVMWSCLLIRSLQSRMPT